VARVCGFHAVVLPMLCFFFFFLGCSGDIFHNQQRLHKADKHIR